MKKLFYLVIVVVLLWGCNFQNITIIGSAPRMDGSTVSIVDRNHKIIYGANIQSGTFQIAQQVLNESGYYFLQVINNKKGEMPMGPFEIYLEPGKYKITFERGKDTYYPTIQSSSTIQNDLTAYHLFTDSILLSARQESDNWIAKMNDPKALILPDIDYQAIVANVKLWQEKLEHIVTTTLASFVAKYPNNKVIPHAMAGMNFEKDPAEFLAIYQKLDNDIKNSKEGKQIGDKLKTLNNLAPGSQAPAFAGETPDNKKVNIHDLHKKIIIVAFWRSGSEQMAGEQYDLAHNLVTQSDSNKVGVISVSFDTDRDTWLSSIKKSGLLHEQISDLKGDDSPNTKNWDIATLPNYYILDGGGKILYNNLSYEALAFSVKEYLAKH